MEVRFFTMIIYIKVGSITNAQRAKSVLMKNAIQSEIKERKIPSLGTAVDMQ